MKNRLIQIVVAGALALVCSLVVRSQFAPAVANARDEGESNYTIVNASEYVRSPSIIATGRAYSQYSTTTGQGITDRTFAVTLSSGTASKGFGSGNEPLGCVGYYNQSTIRSFAINFGHVAAERTMTIKLGGGGTTSDAIAGICRVMESGP